MNTLWQDIRYAVRMLWKRPGFTFVAVLTLALGIGANSAIFSVVSAVMLKPFSFREPERLVVLWERSHKQDLPRMVVSPPNFSDWRTHNNVFQDVAAYRTQDFNVLGLGDPEFVPGIRVSATMFSMLGVRPVLGRDFQPDEDQPGKPSAVLISYGYWQRRFGGDLGVVGRNINLGSETGTIIGVMPADFDFPPPIAFRGEARSTKVELWTQLRYAQESTQRGAHNLFVLARLKDGVSYEGAQSDLQNIAQRLSRDFPETNDGWDAYLVPLHEQVVGDVKSAMWILPVAVAFVLLIACANVANLLLVRATSRQKEMAIRSSLGAGRFHLIRQMLVESTLLAFLAAFFGLLLAVGALRFISAWAPQNIYRLSSVTIDSNMILFTVGLSLLTTLVFGIVPAWQAARVNLVSGLKESTAASSGGTTSKSLRNLLVVVEISLALVLLTGAGLLAKSFIRLQSQPTGFQSDHLVAMTINLPSTSYADRAARSKFVEELWPRLTSVPGVNSVAYGSNLPLDVGLQGTGFSIQGIPVSGQRQPHTQVSLVSPRYFQTMGVPILRGREFTEDDKAESPGVVIINSDLAQKYFPNQDPIGQRLTMGFRDGVFLEIVGVAANLKQTTLQADPYPGMFLPYQQFAGVSRLVFVFRSATEPGALATAVRQQVREVDSQLSVYDVKPMNKVVETAVARPRFMTFLLVIFAAVALLLATIGIYGIMSYTVEQSTREIGIRYALGAQATDVLKLVVSRGLLLTLIGVGIGLAGAFGLTRLLSGVLFDVHPNDPVTFGIVSLFLVIVSLIACYIPARRATKVDPIVALKYE